ncbi:MAG: radical SAM protein [Saprospiraceae bacterium]|nr:radical SAM protein [Saprospiraceae bacterium]
MIYREIKNGTVPIKKGEIDSLANMFKASLNDYLQAKVNKQNADVYLNIVDQICYKLNVDDKNELYALLYLKFRIEIIVEHLSRINISDISEDIINYTRSMLIEDYIIKKNNRMALNKLISIAKKYIVENLIKTIILFNSNGFRSLINAKLSRTKHINFKRHIERFNELRNPDALGVFCHAPFTKLYFSFGGKVIVCCQNQRYVLGKYPERSITEIWTGNKIEVLRNALKHNNLNLGCKECKDILMQGNYKQVAALSSYDNYASFSNNKYPAVMEFEISNTCNLKCIMCFERFSSTIEGKKNVLEDNIYTDDFIDQLKQFIPHLEHVIFKGGEPFLINAYYKIWKLIAEIKPSVLVTIISNATVLNNRVQTVLKNINFQLIVSVDSLIKERYEIIRKGADYQKTMDNLNYFIQLSKTKPASIPRLKMNICIMNNNWDEALDIILFCNKNRIEIFFIMIVIPISLSLKYLGPLTLSLIINKLSNSHLNNNDVIGETTGFSKNEIEENIRNNRMAYNSMLIQIKNWHQEAAQNNISSIMRTFNLNIEDYLIRNKINSIKAMTEMNQVIKYQTKILGMSRNEVYHQLIEMPVEELVAITLNFKQEEVSNKIRNYYLELKKQVSQSSEKK